MGTVQVHEACASERAGCRRRWQTFVDAVELRVVEDVERFPSEFEPGFLVYGEALESAEVEVDASGQVQSVASDIAEGEAGRNGKGIRVIEERSGLSSILVRCKARMGIAHQIGTRAGSGPISHTSVISKVSTVGHAERQALLGDRDALDLPAPEDLVLQSRALEEWQGVDIAD